MSKNHTFSRDDVFPSWWANAIQEPVGVLVENFELRRANDTTVEVPAGSGNDLAVVGIEGKWRYRSTLVSRAMPGGAAGTYPVFAVAAANDINSTPLPFTDDTVYDWGLRIEAPGGTPTIVPGTVDVFRKVGEAVWDGAKITALRQTVGRATGAMLADGAVGASSRVSVARQADGGLLLDLVDAQVSTAKLVDKAVTTGKLDDNAVTLGKLAAAVAQALVPAGSIVATGRSSAPTGYLMCDGAVIKRADFPDLFTAIGTTYGVGDGSTTFGLPDLRGRVPVGVDGTAGRLGASALVPNPDSLGASGGSESHVLTDAELPAHQFVYVPNGTLTWIELNPVGGTSFNVPAVAKPNTPNVAIGAAQPHGNMPPYQIVNYLIKS